MKIFLLVLLSGLLMSCSVEQEPIRFGFDSCDHCKMQIMDPKFGAVILTKKGKNYKFDDVNCLIAYKSKEFTDESKIMSIAIINFAEPQTLIDANNAFYVSSEHIKSPMASSIAAFLTEQQREEFLSKFKGAPLKWDDLKANFK